jgi:hypothetical protein
MVWLTQQMGTVGSSSYDNATYKILVGSFVKYFDSRIGNTAGSSLLKVVLQ